MNSLASKSEEILNLIKELPTEFPEPQINLPANDLDLTEDQKKDSIPKEENLQKSESEEIEIKGVLHEDAFSPDTPEEQELQIPPQQLKSPKNRQ